MANIIRGILHGKLLSLDGSSCKGDDHNISPTFLEIHRKSISVINRQRVSFLNFSLTKDNLRVETKKWKSNRLRRLTETTSYLKCEAKTVYRQWRQNLWAQKCAESRGKAKHVKAVPNVDQWKGLVVSKYNSRSENDPTAMSTNLWTIDFVSIWASLLCIQ